ncbi:cytidyltransferase-like domain-containing protein [Hymenobacter gummosus]|uniref:Cytidyltransferase-like domain-containing protein n=1 Tax=Hymenobacter gummosus TaxID=1776032 RepID=A0A3S0H984_9BACT|nr:AAA family ATPase [Hymenobacter gummosus]RTQ52419.1 cytidyltransferase-like domain-containing protein [Hymenobacter gummosus]
MHATRPVAGLVVGKFAPLHRGHQLLIETAAAQVDELHVWVYSEPDLARVSAAVRAGWLRQLYGAAIGGARLHVRSLSKTEYPGLPPNDAPDLAHREFVRQLLLELNLRIDLVFTSESYGAGFAEHLGAGHVLVDFERRQRPVSGTRLRADVYGLSDWLPPVVQAYFRSEAYVQRVALLGAESTGKSTLAAALAARLGTGFVAEYGRTLWEEKAGQLEFDDLLRIARRHRQLEEAALPAARHWLVSDTNAVTTLWYSYAYFGRAAPELHQLAAECRRRYAHTFVCAPDFPFEQDGTRAPAGQQPLQQHMILLQLDLLGIPYQLLTGSVQERVQQVVAALGEPLTVRL